MKAFSCNHNQIPIAKYIKITDIVHTYIDMVSSQLEISALWITVSCLEANKDYLSVRLSKKKLAFAVNRVGIEALIFTTEYIQHSTHYSINSNKTRKKLKQKLRKLPILEDRHEYVSSAVEKLVHFVVEHMNNR